ncbi:MAG: glycosyltransferase [Gammaproteobacteria bacterium]|nr:glycosyltransferase [Gammaproteobacteria bacterium]
MSSPVISLVVPTYNTAKTVSNLIETIRVQTNQSYEIIVVDGCSDDDTLKIFNASDVNISKIISEKDEGIYDAINKVISLAIGDLINVIGADDKFSNKYVFDNVISSYRNHKADIYAGRTIHLNADESTEYRLDSAYNYGALLNGIPFCHNAMFATKEAYKKIGLYDLKYKICADANWVHRAILSDLTCHRIDEDVIEFSMTGTSSTDTETLFGETYATIQTNFPVLLVDEARYLFEATRGWADCDQVLPILEKYPEEKLLHDAIMCNFIVSDGQVNLRKNEMHDSLLRLNNKRQSILRKSAKKLKSIIGI